VAGAFAQAARHGPERALDMLLQAMEAFSGGRPLPDDVTAVAIRARQDGSRL